MMIRRAALEELMVGGRLLKHHSMMLQSCLCNAQVSQAGELRVGEQLREMELMEMCRTGLEELRLGEPPRKQHLRMPVLQVLVAAQMQLQTILPRVQVHLQTNHSEFPRRLLEASPNNPASQDFLNDFWLLETWALPMPELIGSGPVKLGLLCYVGGVVVRVPIAKYRIACAPLVVKTARLAASSPKNSCVTRPLVC